MTAPLKAVEDNAAAWFGLLARQVDAEVHDGWLVTGDPFPLSNSVFFPRWSDDEADARLDEILWAACLSPFKRGDDLSDEEAAALRDAIVSVLGGALEHYERVVELPIPDKLPLPLQVHRKQGEPCPRCGTTIEAVHYEDYVMCYCPQDQTGGKVLKDRRLSRLLK